MLTITKELEEKEKTLINKLKSGEDINIEGINFMVLSVDWEKNNNRYGFDRLTIQIEASHNN